MAKPTSNIWDEPIANKIDLSDWDNPPPKSDNLPDDGEIEELPLEINQETAINTWLDFIKRYRNDPVAFARNVLGIKLMKHQRAILEAIAKGKRRIAVRSGHRVGKTMLLAIISIWHLVTHYPQKTIVTAPTAGQLFNALVPEIKSIAKKLPPFIYELFDFLSEEIKLKADADGSFLSARTASPENAEGFQGIHSANVLFIWDEASGIDERLFNAARGSMAAPNAISIMAGNPVRLNNTFHRAFTTNAEIFTKFKISSLNLPTVDPDFIHEIVTTHGEDSNEYRVRVLGEFPDTEDESYISAKIVRAARKRDITPAPMSAIVFAVDPARQGNDRTVITIRIGRFFIERQLVFNKKNTMQIVGEIQNLASEYHNRLIAEYKEYGRPLLHLPMVPAAVVVDVIGIGAGVVDRLVELGFNVIAVNVAESATSEPMCASERDAMWKRGNLFLSETKCRIPDDDILETELTASHYDYNSNGMLIMESKKALKKRGLRSPDKADSFLLSLMVPNDIFNTGLAAAGNVGYGSGQSGALRRNVSQPTAH